MSWHWYTCISMNTYCYEIFHVLLEIVWWALSNTSLIVWICLVVHEILANKDFTVTDDLISRLFVVAFVHLTYVQIALIWGFTVQLSLWKLVHWLWRYKLNEVCDSHYYWTSKLLLNIWECTQGWDITNTWVFHFVILSFILIPWNLGYNIL